MGFIKKRIQDNERVQKDLRTLRQLKSNKLYKQTLLCQLKNQTGKNVRYTQES